MARRPHQACRQPFSPPGVPPCRRDRACIPVAVVEWAHQAGVVVDRLFSDPGLAALYDAFCPSEGRGDFGFYLPLLTSAEAVLDAGCGTGALLHEAREAGHVGRLCGLGP